MGKYWFIVLLLVYSFNLQAQVNLVPNPSFEQYVSCPNNTSQVDSCIGWHSVLESPDYYNTCAPYPVCIPDNFCGYQNNFDGNAYVGLVAYAWYIFGREIIGASLLDTMVVGNIYNISMRVSRGNWTNQNSNSAGSNKLGMRFTTYSYNNFTIADISNQAQVFTDSIINDTVNWTLLSWNFVADSAYSNIYIGNFFDDNHTDTVNDGSPYAIAYYFIDSVNVSCVGANCNVGVESILDVEPQIVYNAITHQLSFVDLENLYYQLNIVNLLGQVVKSQSCTEATIIDLSFLNKGIYNLILCDNAKVLTKKIFR
ncbi:MAG: T9SS type A sorting domain-containing protein [Bacteroidetes bacterium]|nr:T9SS type A sorting domain-containing protein [Bacteroidota bacterium]